MEMSEQFTHLVVTDSQRWGKRRDLKIISMKVTLGLGVKPASGSVSIVLALSSDIITPAAKQKKSNEMN